MTDKANQSFSDWKELRGSKYFFTSDSGTSWMLLWDHFGFAPFSKRVHLTPSKKSGFCINLWLIAKSLTKHSLAVRFLLIWIALKVTWAEIGHCYSKAAFTFAKKGLLLFCSSFSKTSSSDLLLNMNLMSSSFSIVLILAPWWYLPITSSMVNLGSLEYVSSFLKSLNTLGMFSLEI